MLEESCENRHLCLISDFIREAFTVSSFNIMLAVRVLQILLRKFEEVLFFLTSVLPRNDLLQNFVKYFSHLFLTTWFFPLILWMWWMNLIDWLTNVNPSLHFWDKTEVVMVCYPFDTFLNYLLLNSFVEDFYMYILSNFIFLCFIWFWYQIMLALKNWLKSILFSKRVCKIWYYIFLE